MKGLGIRIIKKKGLATALMLGAIFLIPNFVVAADKAELFVFFKDLCDDCHGANPKHNILWARAGYNQSGHKKNGNAYYANGEDFQKCHTHEGFIQYVRNGKIDPKRVVNILPNRTATRAMIPIKMATYR